MKSKYETCETSVQKTFACDSKSARMVMHPLQAWVSVSGHSHSDSTQEVTLRLNFTFYSNAGQWDDLQYSKQTISSWERKSGQTNLRPGQNDNDKIEIRED